MALTTRGSSPYFLAKSAPMMACGPSSSWLSALPMSCSRAAPREPDIQLQLRGHDPADVGRLPRVVEVVLPVARPELELAQELHDLRMDVGDPQLEEHLLGHLKHHLVEVFLDLLDHLFYAGRVDASVRHQPL